MGVRQPPGRSTSSAALSRGGCGRPAARRDASALYADPFDQNGDRGAGADQLGAVGRGHPLNRLGRGQRCRDLIARRAAHLGRSSAPVASATHVQAFAQLDLCPKNRGCHRPPNKPARPRGDAIHRQLKPDPSPGAHPPRPASRARPNRPPDTRLNPLRLHDAVCSPRRLGGHRAPPLHAAPPER